MAAAAAAIREAVGAAATARQAESKAQAEANAAEDFTRVDATREWKALCSNGAMDF